MRKLRGWEAAALVLALSGVPALAQEAATETETPVGPPALRDFDLPGRVVAPAPEADPIPTLAPPPPPRAETPPAEDRPETAPPPRREPATASPRASETPAPAPSDRPSTRPAAPEPEPMVSPPAPPPQAEAPVAEAPIARPSATPAAAADAAPTGGVPSWLYGLLALIVGLAAVALLWKQLEMRRARALRAAQLAPRATGPAADPMAPGTAPARPSRPAAEPAAIPNPAAAKEPAPAGPRPRVEIVFKPAKAEATPSGASVHYDLIVKNMGSLPAKGVAIEARMFNADSRQEKEIGAFFSKAAQDKLAAKPFEIPARSQAKLSRAVALDASEVRVVTIQGRRLFIPMVAFNILYEWEGADGRVEKGQTSRCYVVGREPETPNAKMGAFRLDLGPRIYRSVGQRQTTLARNA
jgi:hypothetical protein